MQVIRKNRRHVNVGGFWHEDIETLHSYNLTEGYKITVLRGGSEYGVVILI